MAGKLPDLSTATTTNILQDISRYQPMVMSRNIHSPTSRTENCESHHQSCRPIDKTTTFVLIIDGNATQEFPEALRILRQTVHWNSRAKFILLLFQTYQRLEENINSIFDICWNNQMLDVLLIHMQTETLSIKVQDISAYSYNPFSQHTNTATITIQLSSDSYRNVMCRYEQQFNTLRNLNGYPLRVSTFHHEPKSTLRAKEDGMNYIIGGHDGKLLLLLAKHMNFTPIIKLPKDKVDMSFRRSDGVITGSIGDVAYNRADVSFNSQFLRSDYINDVDFTYPHDKEGFCIIVPKSRRISKFMYLFLPFHSTLWLACGVSIVVIATFWYLTTLKQTGIANYIHVLINALAVFLVNPLRSNTFHKYGKIVFFTWIYSSMVLTAIYRSSLITSLVIPKFYEDINTLKDFDEAGLKLVMFPGIKESAVLGTMSPLRISLNKKTFTTQNFSECIDDLIRYKDRGCACNIMSAKWIVLQGRYFSKGIPQLHLVQECLSWYVEAYEVRRESPFLPYFNFLISGVIESGLSKKWRDDDQSAVAGQKRRMIQASNQKVILQLSHLQAAFFTLIIGLFISILVFLWECGLFSFHQRYFKRQYQKRWLSTTYNYGSV
jgi:hypothetical protein